MIRNELTDFGVVKQAQKAWVAVKKQQDWLYWLQVGRGLLVGRKAAMHEAGTNEPAGRGYNEAFSKWLREKGFADMDKSDRARLFKVMDNVSEVEAWRATLTKTEQYRLNHPATVWRKFEAARNGPKPKRPQIEIEVEEKDRVAQLEEQLAKVTDIDLDEVVAHRLDAMSDRELARRLGRERIIRLAELVTEMAE